MNIEQLKQFMRHMGMSLNCPRCGTEYINDDIKINAYKRNAYNLTLTCHRCSTSMSASISVSGNMLPSFFEKPPTPVKRLYDIKKPEKNAISENNLLQFHEFLKDFDGNFTNILEK